MRNFKRLKKKVNEAGNAYVNSRGDGIQAIKQILERILNRLTRGGQASVKFYDINIAHPDDEDTITQACDIKVNVGGRAYVFKYVVPSTSKEFFDKSIADFCNTNGLSNDMITTMKNLYTLRCCLEMAFNHVEVLGDEDRDWVYIAYNDVLELYRNYNDLLESFVDKVYMKRPDHGKTYCFTNE